MSMADDYIFQDNSAAEELADLGQKFKSLGGVKTKSPGKDALVKLLKVCWTSRAFPRLSAAPLWSLVVGFSLEEAAYRTPEAAALLTCSRGPAWYLCRGVHSCSCWLRSKPKGHWRQ